MTLSGEWTHGVDDDGMLMKLVIGKLGLTCLQEARQTMERVGNTLLSGMKASVRAAAEDGDVSRKDFTRKDILSLLVKANMAGDVPEYSRMSDDEVLSRTPPPLSLSTKADS